MLKTTQQTIPPSSLTPELLKHWISELTDYSPQQIEAILMRIDQEEK